jgi:hypothetical protein
MYWYFEAPHKQPTAAVLAEHPTKQGAEGNLPLVVYQYVGAGKVLFSGVDETWRWRLRVGDQHFGRYWVQMLRFMARSKLMGQKPLEITTDRKRYPRGQTVQVQVRFLNPALAQNIKTVSVQLSKPGEAPRIVALRPLPGTNSAAFFEAAVSGLTEGTYTASYLPPPAVQGDLPATDFIVDPPAGEYAHVEMNRAGLTAAARSTGGQFFRWDENRKLVEVSPSTDTDTPGAASGQSTSTVPKVERSLLELLPPAQKVPLDSDPPVILWNTWPMLATFLFLIAAEWVLRKRMQMV